MRRRIVIGNWKMNPLPDEAAGYACSIEDEVIRLRKEENVTNVDVVVCPPFVGLSEVLPFCGADILIGAQNGWPGDLGAFTGEVSMKMISELKSDRTNAEVEFVIVGHSERRKHQNESSELINQKVKSALEYGLTSIVCVGEFTKVRDDRLEMAGPNDENPDIFLQLKNSLANLSAQEIEKVIIAYEPVWAIGTGEAATANYAEEMIDGLRKTIEEISSKEVSEKVRILYGGSVKGANATEFAAKPTIDGALVGGASLNVEEFGRIIKAFAKS